jgi:hypothetical protein
MVIWRNASIISRIVDNIALLLRHWEDYGKYVRRKVGAIDGIAWIIMPLSAILSAWFGSSCWAQYGLALCH